MITREEIIEIGIFNKAHGVKGEISATIDCEIDVFRKFSCIVVEIDGIFVPFFAESIRPKSQETVLLNIDGFDSDVAVKILVNKTIYVLKAEYSEISSSENCDELPIDYFIGFTVRAADGKVIGEIVDVDDTTDNVLFVVETANGTYPIPAVDDFILDIDEDEKILELDLPDGLFDL